MKKIAIVILTTLFLIFNQSTFGQNSQISGIISSDTTWSSDTIKVTGNVTIPDGIKLTITPGVYVQMQDYYMIKVIGSLFAVGTNVDSIIFTVADPYGFIPNNYSTDGSWDGIHIEGNDTSLDTTLISYCRLEYGKNIDTVNEGVNGGVIYSYKYGKLGINNCLIRNNSNYKDSYAARGGAIYCEEIDNVSIDNNRFVNNFSSTYGGAISIDKLCENVEISNNKFVRNTGWSGAAVHSSGLIYGHTIANNFCFNNYGSANGVIYTSNPYGYIYNNIICNNDASGIFDGHQLSTTRIFGNTVVNNHSNNGGIVICSRAKVYNNICWGNDNEYYNKPDQIYVSTLAYPYIDYNCVSVGDGGNYGIYEDPEFIDPTPGYGTQYNGEAADWSLLLTSPCINTGTEDTTQLNIPTTDIMGNQRIFGNRIDIGAIENQVIYVGINEDITDNGIKIFPNPGHNSLNISSNNTHKNLSLELFNLQGVLVLQANLNTQFLKLNTEKLSEGSYIVKLANNNELIKKGIWIKK